MRKIHYLLVLVSLVCLPVFAQETGQDTAQSEKPPLQENIEVQDVQIESPALPAQEAPSLEIIDVNEEPELPQSLVVASNVTLDFKDADINNVLKIISLKSGINIVATPDVIGNVSIRLVDVPWERALDVILKTYGYAYERQANIILVTKAENIAKIQSEEPLRTEIYNLKFLDAQDAQKVIIPLLSARGKVAILYTKGQKGWQFGSFKIGKESSSSAELTRLQETRQPTETISIEKNPAGGVVSTKVDLPPDVKSKVLVITDTISSLDRIKMFLENIDKKPKQVLIEARIMEVSTDKLRDIGFDWGTGESGASGYTNPPGDIFVNRNNTQSIAGRNLGSEFTPSVFNPLEGITNFPGTYPYAAGLELIYKKIGGTAFEVIIHALEEDARTNTLSAPRIMTLDNQEASMLVGFHTPILTSTVSAGSTTAGPTQTQTLDYYQEIGIRLNVVPQVSEEGYINMIVHPSVTSSSSSVTATSVAGTPPNDIESQINYPIIDVREAQTQIMMKDGETVVIGGLLKDVKGKETIGVPFLSKIPLLGVLFQREITDTNKMDLLIFITAKIVKDNSLSQEEIAMLQNKVDNNVLKNQTRTRNKKN